MADLKDNLAFDSGLTDQTLMHRLRGGEDHAASELYFRYAKRLQQLASSQTSSELSKRVSSDEIVQSVFRTFFRRVSNGQYDAIGGDDLWRLFLVIALNKIRSNAEFHRAQKRDVRRSTLSNFDQGREPSCNSGEEQVAYSVLKLTIEELLSSLPDDQAKIIRLRIEGHSLTEISEISQRAQRTAERVLQGFREKLMKIVNE